MREKILEIFKVNKTPKNGREMNRVFNTFVRSLNPKEQTEYPKAIQELIDEGYIQIDDRFYILTEHGYNYIYRDYTIEGTKNIIIDVFRRHKVRAGQSLMPQNFTTEKQNANRFDFDNFNAAFDSLIADEWLTISPEGYYMLTQIGYDNIY